MGVGVAGHVQGTGDLHQTLRLVLLGGGSSSSALAAAMRAMSNQVCPPMAPIPPLFPSHWPQINHPVLVLCHHCLSLAPPSVVCQVSLVVPPFEGLAAGSAPLALSGFQDLTSLLLSLSRPQTDEDAAVLQLCQSYIAPSSAYGHDSSGREGEAEAVSGCPFAQGSACHHQHASPPAPATMLHALREFLTLPESWLGTASLPRHSAAAAAVAAIQPLGVGPQQVLLLCMLLCPLIILMLP